MVSSLITFVAILPVIVLASFVYRSDVHQKEPTKLLALLFIGGCFSVVPAGLIESILSLFAPPSSMPIANGLYTGFVVAGCTEELCKMAVLMLIAWRSKYFDEYFDGVVYAAFVSLGFAALENISYVFSQQSFIGAMTTGVVRAVLSVPGHFLFSVPMGYFLALAKFEPQNRLRNLFWAVALPIILHGTFDALLMIPENFPNGSEIISSILFVVFIWFDIRMWKVGRARLAHLQALSTWQAVENEAANAGQPQDDRSTPRNNSLSDIDWNV